MGRNNSVVAQSIKRTSLHVFGAIGCMQAARGAIMAAFQTLQLLLLVVTSAVVSGQSLSTRKPMN